MKRTEVGGSKAPEAGPTDGADRSMPLVEIGRPDESLDLEAYKEFVRLSTQNQPVALVTVIGAQGSAPRAMGAAMAVRGDCSIVGTVGGGNTEALLIQHALEAMTDGRPRRFHYDFSGGKDQNIEKACIGKMDFYIQPFARRPKLIVCGAGHVSIALVPLAVSCGFEVTVVDDRPGYPDPEKFPSSVALASGSFAQRLPEIDLDASTYIVVVTYSHRQDEEAVQACLRRPWRYLGMIGSRAKVARVRKDLRVDEETRGHLARIHAPIGLTLGGRSPAEIAVGIMAEILAVRHGQTHVTSSREGKVKNTERRKE